MVSMSDYNPWILWGILAVCMTAVSGRVPRRVGRQPGPYKVPSGPQSFCLPCDKRKCPQIYPDMCPGKLVKDDCGCCPVCDHTEKALGMNTNAESNLTCSDVACPAKEVCMLNIQGIPMCRCPSIFMCRQKRRKEICGRDGKTYKSRCYLKVAECIQDIKIRMAHKGPCTVKTPKYPKGNRKHPLVRKNKRGKRKKGVGKRDRLNKNRRPKREHKHKSNGRVNSGNIYKRWLKRQRSRQQREMN